MNRALRRFRPLGWLCIVMLELSVVACGKSDDSAKARPPATPKETVFDDLVATKARAKQQAEQASAHDKEKLDAAMKQAEESSATP